MILEQTDTGKEFTEDTLLLTLKEKFKLKKSGKDFTKNDIVQYTLRGNIPRQYGGNQLLVQEQYGIKLLVVVGDF